MSKKGRVPFRLDIVGLIPEKFESSLRDAQSLVESRMKGMASGSHQEPSNSESTMLYDKIAKIALDFQRAYGRAVQVRVFRKSQNKFLEKILARGNVEDGIPTFYVNGVKIFKGVPNSFSELDEAIEKAFGSTN
ncbi:MAG: hypothetical protein JRN15_08800 [Nitrososphaerota archaeon]|jgi:hypothetical protein|nr:hypothetical protein [Nitrososphaerota archaeon]